MKKNSIALSLLFCSSLVFGMDPRRVLFPVKNKPTADEPAGFIQANIQIQFLAHNNQINNNYSQGLPKPNFDFENNNDNGKRKLKDPKTPPSTNNKNTPPTPRKNRKK